MSRENNALARAPTRRAVIAALLWLGLAPRTSAQAFPSKSITIVVPYPPGGPIELLARLIARRRTPASQSWWHRPGGSGIIGTGAVARYRVEAFLDSPLICA